MKLKSKHDNNKSLSLNKNKVPIKKVWEKELSMKKAYLIHR